MGNWLTGTARGSEMKVVPPDGYIITGPLKIPHGEQVSRSSLIRPRYHFHPQQQLDI